MFEYNPGTGLSQGRKKGLRLDRKAGKKYPGLSLGAWSQHLDKGADKLMPGRA